MECVAPFIKGRKLLYTKLKRAQIRISVTKLVEIVANNFKMGIDLELFILQNFTKQ